MSDADPVLDGRRLHALTRGDGALARELVAELVREGREEVEHLRRAAAAPDRAALSGAAHKLKGMAAELGAPRLRLAAAELEVESEQARWPAKLAAVEAALEGLAQARDAPSQV